jgi:hypothetical protein
MNYNDMRLVFFEEFELTQTKLDKDDLLKISVPDFPSWVITAYKNNRYKWHELVTSEKELEDCKHNAENCGYFYIVEAVK